MHSQHIFAQSKRVPSVKRRAIVHCCGRQDEDNAQPDMRDTGGYEAGRDDGVGGLMISRYRDLWRPHESAGTARQNALLYQPSQTAPEKSPYRERLKSSMYIVAQMRNSEYSLLQLLSD